MLPMIEETKSSEPAMLRKVVVCDNQYYTDSLGSFLLLGAQHLPYKASKT